MDLTGAHPKLSGTDILEADLPELVKRRTRLNRDMFSMFSLSFGDEPSAAGVLVQNCIALQVSFIFLILEINRL